MFNEFILHISDPAFSIVIFFAYVCVCGLLILKEESHIKLNTWAKALRFFILFITGFPVINITYFSIRFLITRQIFSDIVYGLILYICCLFTAGAVNIFYLLLEDKPKKNSDRDNECPEDYPI